jgi:uncharacterized surface anchored protein
VGGATIQIQGTDDYGNTVVLTATSDANGLYQFTNLASGTYTLTEITTPYGFIGSTTNNYSDIYIPAGSVNTNYNFADLFVGS